MIEPNDPFERDDAMDAPADERGEARPYHLTLDGRRFKELVEAGYLWLKVQESVVNSYNVYPVPDGDTGTNMMHTMRSAWETIAAMDEPSVSAVAKAVSFGSLRGSRGNSGIILSQIWRGFARSLDHKDLCDAQDLAQALREATSTAYAGVNNPVEGTMLTVIREIADSAEQAIVHSHDLRQLLAAITHAAFESVQRTPSLLKILKDAGVVDSGGYGLYVILDGMSRLVNGQPLLAGDAAVSTAGAQPGLLSSPAGGYGYDVQYLIHAKPGQALDVPGIRADIESMGECPLVIGDEHVVKVHVHVPDPGVPISYGAQLGSLRDVVVEDMQAQSDAFTPNALGPASNAAEFQPAELAIVAVASGDGLIRAFKDVGARVVVHGGQTMNPSVNDLLNAIQEANARHVILLPNNANIILAAEQAAQLSDIPTRVVATRTIPQGIAAAIAFNFERDLHGNMAIMTAAAQRVVTCEITRATRTATVHGVAARDGQLIGLIDDKLALAGDDLTALVGGLLELSKVDDKELITLYYGNGLAQAEAEAVAERVRGRYPSHVVDLYEGRQAHYYFVIGVE